MENYVFCVYNNKGGGGEMRQPVNYFYFFVTYIYLVMIRVLLRQ